MPDAVRTLARLTVGTFNAVSFETHWTSLEFNSERETVTTKAFSKTYQDAGARTDDGTFICIYDETSGSPFETALAEYNTPTDGGVDLVYKARGTDTSTPAKQETMKVNLVSYTRSVDPDGVVLANFGFILTDGPPTRVNQS